MMKADDRAAIQMNWRRQQSVRAALLLGEPHLKLSLRARNDRERGMVGLRQPAIMAQKSWVRVSNGRKRTQNRER